MLPFEIMTADYIRETGNHVLYRVTRIFESENLVASGVLMEALSVEDDDAGLRFNVYCYNVQPCMDFRSYVYRPLRNRCRCKIEKLCPLSHCTFHHYML